LAVLKEMLLLGVGVIRRFDCIETKTPKVPITRAIGTLGGTTTCGNSDRIAS